MPTELLPTTIADRNHSHPRCALEGLTTPDLRSVEQMAEHLELKPDSRVRLPLPAGPNRLRHAGVIAKLTGLLTTIRPKLDIAVQIAIDDLELVRERLTTESAHNFSGVVRAKEAFAGQGLEIIPRVQQRSNSVLEVVEAMQEAAKSADVTHLLVPRTGSLLSTRVALGLGHYTSKVVSDSLRLVSVLELPEDPTIRRNTQQNLSELASLTATRLAYLAGSAVFESYVECRGPFESIMTKLHRVKMKLFGE